jgi:hypothetical protein
VSKLEKWITIREHPNYEVSNRGNVRNKRNGYILKPQLNRKDGYHRVSLNGKRYYVHRLVADAFFDGEHQEMDVNHIDGNRLNNDLTNLEWCTRKENIKHTYINGLKYPTVVRVVRCKFCVHRNENDFCASRPDDFFCSDGEKR